MYVSIMMPLRVPYILAALSESVNVLILVQIEHTSLGISRWQRAHEHLILGTVP
eukprot:COSAG01_NODE_4286_length_5174_cov_3.830542_1_plen_54_part_00